MRTQREQTKWDKRKKGRDWKTSHCTPTNSDQGRRSVPSSNLSLLDSRVEPINITRSFYLLQMLSHSLHAHTGKAGLLCVTAHGPVIKTKA